MFDWGSFINTTSFPPFPLLLTLPLWRALVELKGCPLGGRLVHTQLWTFIVGVSDWVEGLIRWIVKSLLDSHGRWWAFLLNAWFRCCGRGCKGWTVMSYSSTGLKGIWKIAHTLILLSKNCWYNIDQPQWFIYREGRVWFKCNVQKCLK